MTPAANAHVADGAASDPPSIVFVNRFFYPDHSATSQILSDLAFELARSGSRIKVVTARGLYDDATTLLPSLETIDGVEIHRVFSARFGRKKIAGRALDYIAMYAAFARAINRIAKAGDIVIAKTDPPLLSVALAPVVHRRGAVFVNWLQDLYPEVALGLGMSWLRPLAPILTTARNASLKSAARNVAIGDLMADKLIDNGVPRNQIVVIPNWCDDHAIDPSLFHQNPLRTEWGLDGKFVVCYSGNLGRAHEYQTLLHAAELLRDREDIVFLFIGGGQLSGLLKAEVAARGLGASFQFRPYQDAKLLPQSLTLPDAHWLSLVPEMEGLIVPSKFYGIAAAGRPTFAITDREGEVARVLRAGRCGVQVNLGDSATLAEMITKLCDDQSLVAELGANARRLLDEQFSRKRSITRWQELLCALLSRVPDARDCQSS